MPEPHSFRFPDGRNLDYIDFGNASGMPVFYFHGIPASGSEVLLIKEELLLAGLRVIAINRPGVGKSDFVPGRRFSDWPNDVAALADALGIGRFAVLGNSGGAAYALACAILIPERLTNVVVVSGAWQMNQPEGLQYLYRSSRLFWAIAANFTFLLPSMLRKTRISPDIPRTSLIARYRQLMAPVDFAVIEQGDRAGIALITKNTGLQQLKGAAHEFRLYAKPNGLDLGKNPMTISFFHGEMDKIVPVELVRKMMARVPGHRLTAYPGDTHLSTFCNHTDDVIRALTVDRADQPEI